MLAIGFLSLLTVGFAVMSAGGDEDVSDVDQDTSAQDAQDEADLTLSYLDGDTLVTQEFNYDPPEGTDPAIIEQVNSYIARLEANPSEALLEEFQQFLSTLDEMEAPAAEAPQEEASDDSAAQEEDSTEPEDTEEPAQVYDLPLAKPGEAEGGRPPMGEEYRDPIVIADELEAQRILDEIAAEEARQPVNLVTVTGASGAEVADALVLSEGSGTGEEADRSFVVTGTDSAHDIDVGYDAEHTFQIEYNEQTGSVTAALNSNIDGPDGSPQKATSTTQDAEGNFITETTFTNGFTSSTDITLNVTPEQIGAHVAQVSFLNSADRLAFDFAPEVNGAFHLFFYESEDGDEGETSATKRAFVVQTTPTQDSLSAAEVNAIAEQGEMRSGTFNVLAEIYLGNDSLFANATPEAGEDATDWVNDFINDSPQISANIAWASVSEHDDGAGEAQTPSDDGGTGGGMVPADGTEEDEIGELFEDIGLNPGFFGF